MYFVMIEKNTILLNLRSTLDLNCVLDKTSFWFYEETKLIKQSWLICVDDLKVYSFWISGFLDCLNIWHVDNLHWLYNIFHWSLLKTQIRTMYILLTGVSGSLSNYNIWQILNRSSCWLFHTVSTFSYHVLKFACFKILVSILVLQYFSMLDCTWDIWPKTFLHIIFYVVIFEHESENPVSYMRRHILR